MVQGSSSRDGIPRHGDGQSSLLQKLPDSAALLPEGGGDLGR
jgi:hypothetical protein